MERLATMFQENRAQMTFIDLINTAVTVGHAVLIALGMTFLVMWGVGLSIRKTFKVDAKNNRFKYWTMRCELCQMQFNGTTQASLNKSFMWHLHNKHVGAE